MKRRWVAQLPDGRYLRSATSWSSEPTSDINRARIWHCRNADTTQHKNVKWLEVEIKLKDAIA